jgi:nucleotide-binding universal stress UspA family protein
MKSDRGPAGQKVPTSDITTSTEQVFRRVLVPVVDASQAGRAAELARRAGASEVRVLHLNLRESAGGRLFSIETQSEAAYVVEAAIFEMRMAGIAASGQLRNALVGKAADEIVAEAAAWGADLIVLGKSRRGSFASRLFGSVTLRVLERAHCPVLVPSSAGLVSTTHAAERQLAGTRS